MKISDMTNDQAAEAMIRLSGPFSNICDDEEALELIDEAKNIGEGIPFVKAFPKILPKFVAFALKKHREDLYEIIGALNMVPAKKITSPGSASSGEICWLNAEELLRRRGAYAG